MSNECLTLHTNQFFFEYNLQQEETNNVSVMSNLRYDGQVGKKIKDGKMIDHIHRAHHTD